MSEGFLTSARTAELFFRFCARYKIVSREDRVKLMREIVRRGQAKYLRDVDIFVKGKKTLKIGFKGDNNVSH